MNLLSIEDISKSFGVKCLFEHVSFGIGVGDKIGLIGVNGTGKSSFLKIIAGLESPDSGKVIAGSHATIEYLPQNPEFDPDATVLQQVFKGNTPVMQTVKEYQETIGKLELQQNDTALQNRLLSLQQQMDALDAWQMESEAKTILTRLGIPQFDAKVGTLSGGQRKRVALANALIHPSDLLILDEPTNHIDHETVDWLEQYLNKRKGALLLVTHDRYFLDRVVNRIIELDQGRLYSYDGSYRYFLEKKAEREEQRESSERKRANLLRRELAWIQRGAKARSTKQKARIDRFEKLQQQSYESGTTKIEISSVATRLGKKVFELERIEKSYDGKRLIQDFTYIVSKEDRVGIIGPNGRGKSTLLNIIAGRIDPDSGSIEKGPTVKHGFFSQESDEMDGNQRVIEYIKEAGEYVFTADGGLISAAQMLERFLFPAALQWTPIGKLSGGEKRRLQLLRILMGAPNVLLLDEPTNDLDIQTLTILEEYLEEFAGAVIAVSHDRYFLDRVVDKLFVFEGDGVIRQYIGNYSEYLESNTMPPKVSDNPAGRQNQEKKHLPTQNHKAKEQEQEKKEHLLKFTYKERKEYDEIEGIIEQAENDLRVINEKIDGAGSDFELLQELFSHKQELEKKLEVLFERWTYLNELAETIAKQRKHES
ncbi:ABC-F family ATP-binding cassette domain-containing protein [Fodinisporobacter ferrooxydans]|uniref:ABC-F family ATP-binding cassette domain-containing protein n=1 Tax=Fodinisporobacter ferrooxydans TaxID=2901836 RepID=A0ABY4CMT8_9BACL|nr:ABC-F family ATP-binding cassette domain-containing protein [Alicyclobacillaceae bacterium MYW30-H2]